MSGLSSAALDGRLAIVLPLLSGALAAAGLVVMVAGLRRRPPSLASILLGEAPVQASESAPQPPPGGVLDRVGEHLAGRVPLLPMTRRALALTGRPAGDLMAEKLVMAVLGLLVPALAWAGALALGLQHPPLPLWLAPGLGLVGWWVPELLLVSGRHRARESATEALFTFIDLVILERLANQSATQSLTRAAAQSDTVLFRELRTALDRTRFEQRPAWQALHTVAARLDLPQLKDVADVMCLDEQGAALGDALRARAAEMRDQHLMVQKIEAQRVSESLTIWMVIPAMAFGLILLTPPLLRMVGT